MNANPAISNPIAPDIRALTPGLAIAFAGRFAVIAAGLVALIARAFLRNPKLAPLILPLCGRLSRNARRLATIMGRLATGKTPRHYRPGRPGGRTAKPPIPTSQAWLIRTLQHEAAAYRSQLSHLLAEPGISDLLDAAPSARRLLGPLSRMLGISDTALRTVARRATPRQERPASQNLTGVFVFKNPESVVAPSLHPPPCPRLRLRWPWISLPHAKPG